MPPALSQIGPYASIDKHIDKLDSIPKINKKPNAARAIPYISKR
jgi:hypothetical protein